MNRSHPGNHALMLAIQDCQSNKSAPRCPSLLFAGLRRTRYQRKQYKDTNLTPRESAQYNDATCRSASALSRAVARYNMLSALFERQQYKDVYPPPVRSDFPNIRTPAPSRMRPLASPRNAHAVPICWRRASKNASSVRISNGSKPAGDGPAGRPRERSATQVRCPITPSGSSFIAF